MQYYVIAFVDIVGYSKLVGREQLAAVERLGEFARDTPFGKQFDDRNFGVLIPTGDGLIAACSQVADNPQRALEFVIELRDRLKPQDVRCGLHVGLGVPFRDINVHHYADPDRPNNVASVAVNQAQRIMSLADPGQILASKDYVEALRTQYPSERLAAEFNRLGTVRVKHGSQVDLFLHSRGVVHTSTKRVRDYLELQSSVVSALQGIQNALLTRHSKNASRLQPRVTLLLHDAVANDLYVTKLRVGHAVSPSDESSSVRFALNEGPGRAFARAQREEPDTVPYFELPTPPSPPLDVNMQYVSDFSEQSGIDPRKIVQFRRPSRAYLYIPVLGVGSNAGRPFGVVSIDTMWPVFDLRSEMDKRQRKGRGDRNSPPKWLKQKIERFNQSIGGELRSIADSWRRIETF